MAKVKMPDDGEIVEAICRRTLVIIPALNETETLPSVLSRLKCWPLTCVRVVGNSSSDKTAELSLRTKTISPALLLGTAVAIRIAFLVMPTGCDMYRLHFAHIKFPRIPSPSPEMSDPPTAEALPAAHNSCRGRDRNCGSCAP